MPKKRAAMCFLVSIMPLWIGLAVAEPQETEPVSPALVEALAVDGQEDLRGVVIEEIPKDSTLEEAGLQLGDVILSWERLPNPPANPDAAKGELTSYPDWLELEAEQVPRGAVVLRGRRGGASLEITVEPGLWEAKVQPVLSQAIEQIYLAGKAQLAAQDVEGAVEVWQSIAEGLVGEDGGVLRAWMAMRIGDAWGQLAEWGKAVEAYREAVKDTDNLTVQVAAWEALGEAHERRNEYHEAEKAYSSALDNRQKLNPKSLGGAKDLNNMGELAADRGELGLAHDYFSRALAISEHFAPKSLLVADSLDNLGTVEHDRGNLEEAYGYFNRALQVREQIVPQSLIVAVNLNNLGFVVQARGDLDRAQFYHSQALQIKKKHAPKSLTLATSLNNLGGVAHLRGDLERAHMYYLQALQIREQLAPQGLAVATSLNNLGAVAQDMGDLSNAHDYYARSLQIREQLAPRSLAVAQSLTNLGSAAWVRSDWGRAHDNHLRALKIKEQLAPQSLVLANSLSNLGAVAWARGEVDVAHDYFLQSLILNEQLAPQSLAAATSLYDLGNTARARGDVDGSFYYYGRALDSLEHQISKLGGSYYVQAAFRAQHSKVYRAMLDLLFTHGRLPEAFHTLERFHAQTFLTMLVERDLAFTADIPVRLDRERRQLRFQYDLALKDLARLNLRDHGLEIEAARRELRKLDAEAGDIEASIRSASPRLAALRYPKPLETAATQRMLDPGSLLLSFSVGKEKTAIFALSPTEDLEVKILPLGEETLRSRVKQLLTLLSEAKGGSSLSAQRRTQLQAISRELYTELLGLVADRIAASERLLILPDGPLHALPFAALLRDTEDGPQYLGAWKPLHVALSATVFAELKQGRSKDTVPAPLQLAAFGDPVYPQSLRAMKISTAALPADGDAVRGDPTVRGAAERGLFDFQPLPHSRREVLGIASLFPEGSVRTFLGPEALEERIKGLDPNTRILHLAAHGSVDEHLPSGSFIALTIPEQTASEETGPQRDNGLLQVWEIFERVRLNADLVVLSACDTGLGEELGGEGLIGLTRAFQYAGARTVMASLWSVQDQATAELMIRFYKHLRAGLTKDRALQAAQQELIRGPIEVTDDKGERVVKDFSAPYYWAGFQLYGDWQ